MTFEQHVQSIMASTGKSREEVLEALRELLANDKSNELREMRRELHLDGKRPVRKQR